MSCDPISDMLAMIKNSSVAKHDRVEIPLSKIKLEIVKIFKHEGFIRNFELTNDNQKIRIYLKYFENKSVITNLKRISKPSIRIYKGKDEIPRIYNGLGVVVVSTPKGVVTGKKAKEIGVGGEILCYIW